MSHLCISFFYCWICTERLSRALSDHLQTIQPVTTIQAETSPGTAIALPSRCNEWVGSLFIAKGLHVIKWNYSDDKAGQTLERISVWPPLPWTWCCSLWWIALPCSLEKPMFYNSSSFPAWLVTHHLWGLKGFGQQLEDTISGSHVARHDLQSKVWRLPCERKPWGHASAEPVSHLCCGETVLKDPTPHLLQSPLHCCWSFTAFLSRLGRFRQLSSNLRAALAFLLELLLIHPGGLHTGEKHHRPPNPTTDWHLTLQGGKSPSLSYSTVGITRKQDSTSNHHKTLEQKLSILLQNQTDAFQFNKFAIGRNVLGQGKFNINSGHGKQCLHTNESHCNAISYNTLCPWKISKKERFFTSGRTNRWLALPRPGSLLCPSHFEPSFKAELQKPRRTWRMRRHIPRICFQTQHWHSLCPSFRKMFLMQGRAKDCLQPPDKDNMA